MIRWTRPLAALFISASVSACGDISGGGTPASCVGPLDNPKAREDCLRDTKADVTAFAGNYSDQIRRIAMDHFIKKNLDKGRSGNAVLDNISEKCTFKAASDPTTLVPTLGRCLDEIDRRKNKIVNDDPRYDYDKEIYNELRERLARLNASFSPQ